MTKLKGFVAVGMMLGLVMGASLPAFAAGGTATYNVTIQSPAAVTLSSTTASDGLMYSSSSISSVSDSSLTITNSGTNPGTLYGAVTSVPASLTLMTTNPTTANQLRVQTTGGTGSMGTTAGIIDNPPLAGGASMAIPVNFIFGPGTSAGNYAIGITYTLE